MAEQREKHFLPHDPILLHPANEAVVDGATVVFEWEPGEGVDEYLLQVSAENSFSTLVLEERLTGQSRFTPPNGFPVDGETYFWRVIARSSQGTSPGETIESFISVGSELAAEHLSRPDDDEGYGPYPQLMKSGGKGIAAQVTGRQAFYDEEAAMGVEHEGVESGQIAMLAGIVLLILVGLISSVFLLYNNLQRTQRYMVTGLSGYPELRETKESAAQKLGRYGIVDDQGDVYQIPIEQAMELTVRESRAGAGTQYSSELPLVPDYANVADSLVVPAQDTPEVQDVSTAAPSSATRPE